MKLVQVANCGAMIFNRYITKLNLPNLYYRFSGPGVLVCAVSNMPSQLPEEASSDFGELLLPLIPDLVSAHGFCKISYWLSKHNLIAKQECKVTFRNQIEIWNRNVCVLNIGKRLIFSHTHAPIWNYIFTPCIFTIRVQKGKWLSVISSFMTNRSFSIILFVIYIVMIN